MRHRSSAISETGSVFVGALNLDDGSLAAMSSGSGNYSSARVLTRVHNVPIGYVTIPYEPGETLAGRAREAAHTSMAELLLEHRRLDVVHSDVDPAASNTEDGWISQVSCSHHFPQPTGPGISIIVCTRDRPTELRQCLRALREVRYTPLEIVVVDNAPSSDATSDVVAEYARDDVRIRYTRQPAPGLSRARNHGVACATYDLLAFTDDDIYVEPTWPEAIAAGFAADPETGCITGPVTSLALDTESQRYFDARYPWGNAFAARRFDMFAHRDPSPLYPFQAGRFGTGANFAMRRGILEEVGEFDTLLGAGSIARGAEDLDMFVRIILGGHRLCYLPAALVWHRHRADDEALAEQVYSYGHGLGGYLAKRLMTRQVRLSAMVAGAAYSKVLARQMRQASAASQAKSRGTKLAVTEVTAVLAGAVRYYRSARRRSNPADRV